MSFDELMYTVVGSKLYLEMFIPTNVIKQHIL